MLWRIVTSELCTLWWRSRPLITLVWCTPQTKSFCLPPAPWLPRKPCVSVCVCVCGTARDWLLGARCFPIKPVTGVWEPPSMSGAERVLLGQTVLSCYGDVWTAWCTRIEPHHSAGLHYIGDFSEISVKGASLYFWHQIFFFFVFSCSIDPIQILAECGTDRCAVHTNSRQIVTALYQRCKYKHAHTDINSVVNNKFLCMCVPQHHV